jgi:hypothetical protein
MRLMIIVQGHRGEPRRRAGSAVNTTRRRGNSEGSNPVQRGDGRWQVHIRHTDEDGRSRRYTVYGSTPEEARAKASAVRERLRANLPARDRRVTLGVFGLSGSTQRWRRRVAKRPQRRCTPRWRGSTSSAAKSAGNRSTSSGRLTSRRGKLSFSTAGSLSPPSGLRTQSSVPCSTPPSGIERSLKIPPTPSVVRGCLLRRRLTRSSAPAAAGGEAEPVRAAV